MGDKMWDVEIEYRKFQALLDYIKHHSRIPSDVKQEITKQLNQAKTKKKLYMPFF